jgi:hypothetical protein
VECDLAREAMLECEPEELEGLGGSPLAEHIRECDRCRRVGRVLLAELGALDAALDSTAAEAAEPAGPRAGVRRLRWRVLLPLAAAAALALVVTRWPEPRPVGPSAARVASGPSAAAGSARGAEARPATSPPGVGEPALDAAFEPRLRVSAPPGTRVMVFQTRDPSVAVVWFLSAPNGG